MAGVHLLVGLGAGARCCAWNDSTPSNGEISLQCHLEGPLHQQMLRSQLCPSEGPAAWGMSLCKALIW